METGRVEGVRKIAVLRATVLGDLIFALPALRALHDTYPQAEITYLGRDWHAAFLPGRLAGLKRVARVPLPKDSADINAGRVIEPSLEAPFLAPLVLEGFDLALQLHGGGRYSNPLIRMLRARVSAGARSPDSDAPDRWIPYVYYQHEVLRALEVAALVGAALPSDRLTPELKVLPGDRAAANAALPPDDAPLVVIHAGTTDERRQWSPENFAQVADDCVERFGARVALTGTARESGITAAVREAMRHPAADLCGRLDLSALTGLLARARLVIANDTGPLHLALAVGAAAVGIFWCEYIVNSLPLNRARFIPLIAWERNCPLCGAFIDKAEIERSDPRPCAHITSFVNSVTAGQVMQAVEQLMAFEPIPGGLGQHNSCV